MRTQPIITAALALLLAACGNEDILETHASGSGEKVRMTFTAGMPQSRTSLADDGHAVNWTPGDKVAICDGTALLCAFEATAVNGSRATLTGEAQATTTYTAFYPFETATSLTHEAITFELPATQTATSGSFAEGLNPSWAQSTDGSNTLQFQNLCALAKFTVETDGVTEVTLTANSEEDALAGELTYGIADRELTHGANASRSVTLTGGFTQDGTYYFVVAPGTLAGGLTLDYKDADGKTFVRATTDDVTFTAGTITSLGTLNVDHFTENRLTNTDFIAAVTNVAPEIGWAVNLDGTVSLTEANRQKMAAVTTLDLMFANLADLTGIEYFTGLTHLDCSYNHLTTLNINGLTNLTTLDCSNNQLQSLEVNGLTNLTTLDCGNNQLQTLEVNGLTNLTTLDCSNNQLQTLEVSGLTYLTSLDCSANQLTVLEVNDLTYLAALYCSANQLTVLEVNGLTYLATLSCYGNQLQTLEVNGLSRLSSLDCGINQLTTLEVSGLTSLTSLDCNNNLLQSLEVNDLTNLEILYCQNNQLTALDVGRLTKLTHLFCNDNRLTMLDISILTTLNWLLCGRQQETLTLTLLSTQEEWWERMKTSYPTTNTNVVTVVASGTAGAAVHALGKASEMSTIPYSPKPGRSKLRMVAYRTSK